MTCYVAADFSTFFNNSSNARAVYRPGKDAKNQFGHAVVLVGYNNNHNPPYWVAKNSYGPTWADNGLFKV
jgi:C1A family cysteine protease